MTKLPILTMAVTALLVAISGNTVVEAAIVESPATLAASVFLGQDEADAKKPDAEEKKEAVSEKVDPARAAKIAEASAVLEKARRRMIDYASIKATIVETVAIGQRKFKVTGNYLQGSGLRLRLDFKAQLGNSTGSVLEICDGEVLWTRHKVGKQQQITRRNVRDILNAVSNSPNLPKDMMIAELSLGGLPGLLASVQRTWEFDSISEESIGDKKFTVIKGGWQKSFKEKFPKITEAGDLPAYIPDRLELYFDNEFNFPHRIMYRKRPLGKKFLRPMVTIDFTEIVLDEAVNEEEFYFLPPDEVTPIDVTKRYLDQIARIANPKAAATPGTPPSPSVKANDGTKLNLKNGLK